MSNIKTDLNTGVNPEDEVDGRDSGDVSWEKVGHAIREARKSLGLSQSKLGELIGVTGAAVSNWEKGRDLNYARVAALGKHLKLDVAIPGGGGFPGELFPATLEQIPGISVVVEEILARHLIPKIEQSELENPEEYQKVNDVTGHHFPCSPNSFAIIVGDRSNAPEIMPGDVVVIDPNLTPRPEDMVLIRVPTGIVLRRLRIVQAHDGSRVYELQPVNHAWPTERVAHGDWHNALGVVTELAKRLL